MGGRSIRMEAFIATDYASTEKVLQSIKAQYQIRGMGSRKVHEKFYDTFDWRLFKKGYFLRCKEGTFFLCTTDNNPIHQSTGLSRKTFFAHDLDGIEMANVLHSAASIRALINIFKVSIERKKYNLHNKDGKTVLRLHVDDGQVFGNKRESTLPVFICLGEIKGYEKAFNKVVKILKENGLQRAKDGDSLFQLALSAIDRAPLDYSSKFAIKLEKSATLFETVNAICLNLVTAMHNNIEGVIGDIDSEFLHDFRIAIRRTRSLLSQMKKQLPPNIYSHFQGEFKWLGAITSPVRDLDVYLLKRGEYESMLPAQLHSGLNELFVDLERNRKNKLILMHRGLSSPRYEKLMGDWSEFLISGVEESDWPSRNIICQPLAVKMISKRYHRLIKDGSKIVEQSPDEELHRLRIQGKKLRYLLEFYRSFFNADEIDFFLKHLKKLQNNLGDFNDISVQQDMLSDFQEKLTGRSKRSVGIAAALGGLISHLSQEQIQVRKKFEKTFRNFGSDTNRYKFVNIINPATR